MYTMSETSALDVDGWGLAFQFALASDRGSHFVPWDGGDKKIHGPHVAGTIWRVFVAMPLFKCKRLRDVSSVETVGRTWFGVQTLSKPRNLSSLKVLHALRVARPVEELSQSAALFRIWRWRILENWNKNISFIFWFTANNITFAVYLWSDML